MHTKHLLLLTALAVAGPWEVDSSEEGLELVSLEEINAPHTKRELLGSVSSEVLLMIVGHQEFPQELRPTYRLFDWERSYFGLPELAQQYSRTHGSGFVFVYCSIHV